MGTAKMFIDWKDAATAPEYTTVLVVSRDGVYLAERQGKEWVPCYDVPEDNAAPTMWAAEPVVPRHGPVENVLDWLEDDDREMILECLAGGETPDQLDSEFLDEGVFAPCLVPWFKLGARQPCGYSVGFKLTEYGVKVAEAILAADGDE